MNIALNVDSFFTGYVLLTAFNNNK